MINPWFKFYGGEYLSDPKMLALNASERSCWITLLCYMSVVNDNANDNAEVKHLTEERLMIQSGLEVGSDEWQRTKGVLNKFENLEMIHVDNGVITITNWKKRQQSSLTPYERVKKYRDKKRIDNANDNDEITTEENREEEKRIEEKNMDFEIFWKIYPKHTGKKKAKEYWEKLSFEIQKKAIDDIPKRKADEKWINGFYKDPERYIKNEQWNDDIIPPKKLIDVKRQVDTFSKTT